jgi:trans-aconitate 2-methyltransferase
VPDHKKLIREFMGLLGKGGVLAVQIPMNFNEPIHRIIKEVSTSDKWKGFFPETRIYYTLTPGEYFDILSELTENFDLWETVYYHVMKSHNDILERYRGTGLRPYRNALLYLI